MMTLILTLILPLTVMGMDTGLWMHVGSQNQPVFNVRDFGAVGDGVTDDTRAFQEASKALQEAGGGIMEIPGGIYVIGGQTRQPGQYPPYIPTPMVDLKNLDGVVIEGNGATLRLASGLRFGSFDKNSGEPIDPPMPFYDRDCAVSTGHMITLTNCRNVVIRNLELDGNSDTLMLGGQWGDTGRQLAGCGLCLYGNTNVLIENVHAHHHPLDGVMIGWPGLKDTDPPTPHLLRNVVCKYNARQGLSWVGGRGLVAIGCRFNHTGRGRFASAPGAGLDIEAEESVCREGLFVNCEFVDNTGCGIVADSGDGGYTRFVNCRMWGTTTWSVWSAKPGLQYEFCEIFGSAVHGHGSPDPGLATRYVGCRFEDREYPGRGVYRAAGLVESGGGDNIHFENCVFIAHATRSLWIDGADTKEMLRNCTVVHECPRQDQDFVCLIRGSVLENVKFLEHYPESYSARHFIAVEQVVVGRDVLVAGPVARWGSWGGITGVVPLSE